MARLEFDIDTSLSPERVTQALLDFSPRRPETWPGIEPSLYEVYSVGETSADIREGTKLPGTKIWAREHYDWATPGTITWTVVESNFSAPGSYLSANIKPAEGGGSHLHVVWERTGTTLVGRAVVFMIKVSKGKPLATSMKKAFDRLENAK
jgi:hypothetical protein